MTEVKARAEQMLANAVKFYKNRRTFVKTQTKAGSNTISQGDL